MEEPLYNEVCVDDRICPTDLKCAICHSVYVFPVMLSCGHSFCDACAQNWLETRDTCPTCRQHSSGKPIKNIALGQIVDEHNRVLTERCSSFVSDDFDEDERNTSSTSMTPTETFVRCHEVRLSKRTRKNSNAVHLRRLNSTSESSSSLAQLDSPSFVRANTVRFASSLDRTPLHVLAARKRLEDKTWNGMTPAMDTMMWQTCKQFNIRHNVECSHEINVQCVSVDNTESPVSRRFERRPNLYSSPSRHSDSAAVLADPSSPVMREIKRGGVLRRSLGLLRKSVRLLRRESTKSVRKDSLEEVKEEEAVKVEAKEEEKVELGQRQSFRRKSLRKSFIRALRGLKYVRGGTVASGSETNTEGECTEAQQQPQSLPPRLATAKVLIIDSTANLQLIPFLRSLAGMPSDMANNVRVLSSTERREMPLLMEEYEGLQLVSIVFKDSSDTNCLILYDIYEGRREMSGEVEHCTLLLKCCNAALLFFGSDPSSALQATSDFRYVQKERKEMNLRALPMWTVLATQPVDSPPRGRAGSSLSSAGSNQGRNFSLAQANRLSSTELTTRLLPAQQRHLQISVPLKEEFVRGLEDILVDLKPIALCETN